MAEFLPEDATVASWSVGVWADAAEVIIDDAACAQRTVDAVLAHGRELTWSKSCQALSEQFNHALALPSVGSIDAVEGRGMFRYPRIRWVPGRIQRASGMLGSVTRRIRSRHSQRK